MTTLTALIRKWEFKSKVKLELVHRSRAAGLDGAANHGQVLAFAYEDFLRDLRSLKKPKRTKKGER